MSSGQIIFPAGSRKEKCLNEESMLLFCVIEFCENVEILESKTLIIYFLF